MSDSAERTVGAIAEKMANDLMQPEEETAPPAKTAPSPTSDMEIPSFLVRSASATKRKTRKTEVPTTSREEYARKFPDTRTPRNATKDRTSQKLLQLRESFNEKNGDAVIPKRQFDAAMALLRDDLGDMLSAFGCEYASDAAHRALKKMLGEFVRDNTKFRGKNTARKIKVI